MLHPTFPACRTDKLAVDRGDLYLELGSMHLAGAQPFYAPRPFLRLVPSDLAGGGFETHDVGSFSGHRPLDELRQLLGPKPDRESQAAFECGVLEPRLGPTFGVRLRTVEEDALLETRRRAR